VIPALLAAVTFHADIEPLLERRCKGCHRKGEIGPMPLETYEQARPRAKAIRQAVVLGKMPPWFATQGGPFLNKARLTESEIRVFDKWAAQGAPRGRPEPGRQPRGGGWRGGTFRRRTQRSRRQRASRRRRGARWSNR
jgi:hypothetical protein